MPHDPPHRAVHASAPGSDPSRWAALRLAGLGHRDGPAQLTPLGAASLDARVAAVLRAAQATVPERASPRALVVSGLSAAWAHGALAELAEPVEVTVDRAHRVRVRAHPSLVFPERRYLDGDAVPVRHGAVTAPLRTVFDLLLRPDDRLTWADRGRDAAATLLLGQADPRAAAARLGARLAERARRPGSRLARERYGQLLAASGPDSPAPEAPDTR